MAQRPRGVDCPAIDGILEEAEEVTGDVDDKDVLDAALIASAQAVEHYEMTRYVNRRAKLTLDRRPMLTPLVVRDGERPTG